MNKKYLFGIVLIILICLFAFLVRDRGAVKNNDVIKASIQIANPADTFCVSSGGVLSSVNSGAGVYSNCTFPSGKMCESWALFRGECLIEGVNNYVVYKNSSSGVSVGANFRIKTNSVILDSKELGISYNELKQAESGSGIRYLSVDGKIEFWEHQGEVTITKEGKQIFVGKIK